MKSTPSIHNPRRLRLKEDPARTLKGALGPMPTEVQAINNDSKNTLTTNDLANDAIKEYIDLGHWQVKYLKTNGTPKFL